VGSKIRRFLGPVLSSLIANRERHHFGGPGLVTSQTEDRTSSPKIGYPELVDRAIFGIRVVGSLLATLEPALDKSSPLLILDPRLNPHVRRT